MTLAERLTARPLRPAPVSLIGPRLVGALLVVATTCGLVEAVLSPLTTSTTAADILAIQAHQDRYVVSVLIGLAGTLTLLPGIVGLTAHTVRRSPWASRLAAALAIVGLPAFWGLRLGQGVELQGIRDGLPRHTTAHLMDHLEGNPIAAPIVTLFLLGTIVGMLTLAVAVWRSRLSRPAAVLIVVFPVVDMGLESLGGTAVAHALLVAAMVLVAVRLWRTVGRADAAEPLPGHRSVATVAG